MYGAASHLIHADCDALELMHDRALRSPDELAALKAAHVCRIFSGQVSFFYVCAEALRRMYKDEFLDANAMLDAWKNCDRISRSHLEAFNESQRAFYADFGAEE